MDPVERRSVLQPLLRLYYNRIGRLSIPDFQTARVGGGLCYKNVGFADIFIPALSPKGLTGFGAVCIIIAEATETVCRSLVVQ